MSNKTGLTVEPQLMLKQMCFWDILETEGSKLRRLYNIFYAFKQTCSLKQTWLVQTRSMAMIKGSFLLHRIVLHATPLTYFWYARLSVFFYDHPWLASLYASLRLTRILNAFNIYHFTVYQQKLTSTKMLNEASGKCRLTVNSTCR